MFIVPLFQKKKSFHFPNIYCVHFFASLKWPSIFFFKCLIYFFKKEHFSLRSTWENRSECSCFSFLNENIFCVEKNSLVKFHWKWNDILVNLFGFSMTVSVFYDMAIVFRFSFVLFTLFLENNLFEGRYEERSDSPVCVLPAAKLLQTFY